MMESGKGMPTPYLWCLLSDPVTHWSQVLHTCWLQVSCTGDVSVALQNPYKMYAHIS